MKTNHIRQNVFPVITAFIWGTSFAAQSVIADYIGPFTFNAVRSVVACVFVFGLNLLLKMRRKRDFMGQAQAVPTARRDLALGGLFCGLALTIGNTLQQIGLETTTAGKASFISALYIVVIPVVGIFLHKKAPKTIWISVLLAVAGLYFLCIQEDFTISSGDFLIFISSFCFAAHIIIVDYFTQKVDGVELSCVQFFVMVLCTSAGMLFTESPSLEGIGLCIWPILYVGVFSSGVAYTLQILAQKDSNPTVVAMLLSLESVFGTLAGAVILGDQMSGREYFGCVLMLVAVVLAQLPTPVKAKTNEEPQTQAAQAEDII